MKINTKVQYGLKFMINLAVADNQNFLQLSKIVSKEDLSIKYLENIVGLIRTSGLIQMKRGVKGGYKLARPASQIMLLDIIQSLEGATLALDETVTKDKDSSAGEKVLQLFTNEYKTIITDFLKKKSLQDLVDVYQQQKGQNMFFI